MQDKPSTSDLLKAFTSEPDQNMVDAIVYLAEAIREAVDTQSSSGTASASEIGQGLRLIGQAIVRLAETVEGVSGAIYGIVDQLSPQASSPHGGPIPTIMSPAAK